MNRNTITIIVIVAVVTAGIVYLMQKPCASCPNITSAQYKNNPTGKCLYDCDVQSDVCYNQCDPKDDQCISKCYAAKTACYMTCLGPQEQVCAQVCGCKEKND